MYNILSQYIIRTVTIHNVFSQYIIFTLTIKTWTVTIHNIYCHNTKYVLAKYIKCTVNIYNI